MKHIKVFAFIALFSFTVLPFSLLIMFSPVFLLTMLHLPQALYIPLSITAVSAGFIAVIFGSSYFMERASRYQWYNALNTYLTH